MKAGIINFLPQRGREDKNKLANFSGISPSYETEMAKLYKLPLLALEFQGLSFWICFGLFQLIWKIAHF